MTKREAAICSVHTGINFLAGEDFHYIHEYMEQLMSRPLMTHEIPMYEEELKELSTPDFVEMCRQIAEPVYPSVHCPANDLPKEEKDMMWYFLMTGGQRANIPELKDVLNACTSWTTAEQRRKIESAMILAMHGVQVTKEETALSSTFAQPNEWYLMQFIAIKRIKGLSDKTLTYYRLTIEQFLRIVPKAIPEVDANDIRYYLAVRETQDGLCKVSLANELRNLRSFFGTLSNEEMIAKNPTAKIDSVKVEKKVKKPFTEYEMEQIRRACTNRNGLNKKHLAIVEVLYSTGCRVGELVGMDRNDIEGDRILVTGKGNKQRWVYLNPRAQIALADWLNSRTDSFPAVFIGESVTGKISDRMDTSSVESVIRTIGKRAGVEDCHPHRFRRTAATTALRRGMPIEQVSKMLGHEQISTTQIYAVTEDEAVQDAHKKYLT